MTINYQFGDVDAHGAMIRALAGLLEAEHQAIISDVLTASDFWGGAGSAACQGFITQLGRNFQVIYDVSKMRVDASRIDYKGIADKESTVTLRGTTLNQGGYRSLLGAFELGAVSDRIPTGQLKLPSNQAVDLQYVFSENGREAIRQSIHVAPKPSRRCVLMRPVLITRASPIRSPR